MKHFKCLTKAECKAKIQSLGDKINFIFSLTIFLLDYIKVC